MVNVGTSSGHLADLGGGLVLRRGTTADAEKLSAFNAEVHRGAQPVPSEAIGVWTRDLLERPHPTVRPEDFTLVEDTRTGAIVSTLNLISQTWSYDGIRIGVGRPEMVGTDPEYRRRGLVRRQFEMIHGWSDARGELVQAITGIAYYYRQFGYEMGLELGAGRSGYRQHIPALAEGEADPYSVRAATADDLPLIARIYEQGSRRYLVACVRDAAQWRYELDGRSDGSAAARCLHVITTASGEAVGFLALRPLTGAGTTLVVTAYELALGDASYGIAGGPAGPPAQGASWLSVTPSVLRAIGSMGQAYERAADGRRFEGFTFALGTDHPVYRVAADRLPVVVKPYAWYVRVADVPGLLRHIAPALERRLAQSDAAGYTGDLHLSWYRGGVRISFAAGCLAEVSPWTPIGAAPATVATTATFPDLTFLQLLFGYRSLDELEYAFADCRARGDIARVLLNALFPKRPSLVWPVA